MSSPVFHLADLIWRPVVPPGWLMLIGAVLAVLAAAAYARTFRGEPMKSLPLLVMRLLAIAALIALLLGPSVIPPRRTQPARPPLTILLDTSRSMLTDDVQGGARARHVLDHWLTPDQLQRLSENYDVRLAGFDERPRNISTGELTRPVEDLIAGSHSNYADALSGALLDIPSDRKNAAVLIVGDGHDSERRPLGPAAALAERRGVAIHSLPIGTAAQTRDLALIAVPRQDYLLAGETGQIMVQLHQVGAGDQPVTLRWRGPGIDETRRVEFNRADSVSIDVPIQHEEPGIYEYTISVDPLAGERVTANNQQPAFVEVTERRVRVLILEGEPYWDTRFIAQSLRADPNLEIVHISQVSAQKRQDVVTRTNRSEVQLPQTADDFAAYDVVVLGSGLEHVLTPEAAAALDDYVWRTGGHVIFARGRAYDPDTLQGSAIGRAIAPIEPVQWGGGLMHNLPLALTPAGRSSPAFSFLGVTAGERDLIERLPPMTVAPTIDQVKPATIVLAHFGRPAAVTTAAGPLAAQNPPAIAVMNYGRGSVFAILGEGLWQWGFLPPELKQYAGVFDAFWSSVVRWMAMGGEFQPGAQVSLRLSGSSVRLGDPIIIDVATRGSAPPGFSPTITLIDPQGRTLPLEASQDDGVIRRLQVNITPTHTGAWKVVVDAAPLDPPRLERRFTVYDLDLERLHAEARPQVLAELSKQTGGIVFDADAAVDIAARLERHTAAQLAPPEPRYVWDSGVFLAALVTWMGLEWIGRRQAGWL